MLQIIGGTMNLKIAYIMNGLFFDTRNDPALRGIRGIALKKMKKAILMNR